jgi:hypothetical protein
LELARAILGVAPPELESGAEAVTADTPPGTGSTTPSLALKSKPECVVNRRADLDRLATRALTDIDLFQAALTEQQQQSTVLLRGRDQEIERLVSGQGNNNVLNYTLASAAGLVVGFGLFGSLYALVK